MVAQPAIRAAGRFPHVDRRYEVVYRAPTHALHLYDYACAMRLGRRRLAVEAGDVTLTPAGIAASYDLPRPGTHLCIHFVPADVRRGGASVSLPLHLRTGGRREGIARAMLAVAELHQRGARHALSAAAASAALQALLLRLAADATEPPPAAVSPSDAPLRLAVELLTADLRRPLDVPALSRRVGLSQNYLARRFKQRFGVTIPRYLLQARVEQAHLLLTTTSLPIKDIAARVGLPDPQHFNKQFRRITGASPSAIRGAASSA